jgi:hypothetical protein
VLVIATKSADASPLATSCEASRCQSARWWPDASKLLVSGPLSDGVKRRARLDRLKLALRRSRAGLCTGFVKFGGHPRHLPATHHSALVDVEDVRPEISTLPFFHASPQDARVGMMSDFFKQFRRSFLVAAGSSHTAPFSTSYRRFKTKVEL